MSGWGPPRGAQGGGCHALAPGPDRAQTSPVTVAEAREEGGRLRGRVALRDMAAHVSSCHSLLCFLFLLSLPAPRTHNLTVLPSHNSTFVSTNDSAYSNLSATVGEHTSTPPGAARGGRHAIGGLCRPAPCEPPRPGWQTCAGPGRRPRGPGAAGRVPSGLRGPGSPTPNRTCGRRFANHSDCGCLHGPRAPGGAGPRGDRGGDSETPPKEFAVL